MPHFRMRNFCVPRHSRRKRKLMDDQIRLMRERGERLREAAQSIGIT
ncbi:repressor, partial [Gluconobacter oxydans]